MFALEVRSLSKSFQVGFFNKKVEILKEVSFSLRSGVTTGFVGVNGSGKTTTLKCVMDFIRPDQGEILFFGAKMSVDNKMRLGYLPERPYLYDFLTGMEFLRFHWDLWGGEMPERFDERAFATLKRVNLLHAKDKKLRTYSKGMLQRIGIAQAILTEPDLIIFDEPMSGLDPDGRFLVKEILKQERLRGATIFFSSHLLQDMDELCEDLVVLDKGKVLYSGPLTDFRKNQSGLEQAFESFRKGDAE